MSSKQTPEKKLAFIAALGATCSVKKACEAVGISRESAYNWREEDTAFEEAWERAKSKIGSSVLEDEAVRRGVEGSVENIYYKGAIIDTVRKYSDTLLIFLLKGALPEKYAERSKAELTNPDGNLLGMTPDQVAARLEAILKAAKKRKEAADDGADLV